MNATVTPSAATVARAIRVTAALAEAIRAVGSVPSGHLYARVVGQMGIDTFTGAIELLKRAGLVEEKGHELRWIGPALEENGT